MVGQIFYPINNGSLFHNIYEICIRLNFGNILSQIHTLVQIILAYKKIITAHELSIQLTR